MNAHNKDKIYENEAVVVFLEYNILDGSFVLLVKDKYTDKKLKVWKIVCEKNLWCIENHQMKDNQYFEYEFVRYPIKWNSLEDLLNDFQQVTNNFTYFFEFVPDEID